MLVIGMFMEALAAMLIFIPVFMPLVKMMGYDQSISSWSFLC